jgi:5-(hydroxymethyl)furfural/furfural oxidase
MAARLSEEPTLRVTLVEAGSDTVPGEVPDDIKDIFPRSFLNRDYFWPNLAASLTDRDAARPFPQARVVGGGSSVMGMIALRGFPSDYDGLGGQRRTQLGLARRPALFPRDDLRPRPAGTGAEH